MNHIRLRNALEKAGVKVVHLEDKDINGRAYFYAETDKKIVQWDMFLNDGTIHFIKAGSKRHIQENIGRVDDYCPWWFPKQIKMIVNYMREAE